MVVKKIDVPFIKAIPLDWIKLILNLNGSATKTALLLWYLSGINQTQKNLVVTYAKAESLGINKSSLLRGLLVLETKGIIEVVREQGKAPRVTIIYGR